MRHSALMVLGIVTASGDGTARVWKADSGQVLTILRGHEAEVVYVEFSPCWRPDCYCIT